MRDRILFIGFALSCIAIITMGQVSINSNGADPSMPAGAVLVLGNATGSTSAVVGTLAAAASKTTYICGVAVSAIGGTATIGPVTIAGPATSLVYQLASTAAGNVFTQTFRPCIPGSAVNTAITTTTTADGTATAVDVVSWGYQR